tara:strand:+ start:3019 stop:3699 length:681 start_codon:yes stop_codon:yes gene_type:complete
MNTHALEFRNVSKVYETDGGDRLAALDEVSFVIEPGKTVAIVGRSGSGKSTLLHMAAGIDIPTSGDVSIDGQLLADLSEGDRTLLRRNRIGLIFQFFYLMQHLSVYDNVALPSMIAGDAPGLVEPRVMELLERVGMADRSRDRVQKLSGGEMQRVAICRALLKRPRLLLADEPTGNLDDENGRMVMELILSLAREENGTLIYVTHSPDFAGMADETMQIHSGKVIA